MKNTIKLFGIIAFIAVLGFGMAACNGDDNGGGGGTPPSLNGTWVNTTEEGIKLVLNNGSITVSFGTGAQAIEAMKGTYTTSTTAMTVTFTQVNGDQLSNWLEGVLEVLEQTQPGASQLQVELTGTQLYTEAQFKAAVVQAIVSQWGASGINEAAAAGMVDNMLTPAFQSPFSAQEIPYTLSGNTLTVTMGGSPIVFTKQQ